jgi:hypothetical protein
MPLGYIQPVGNPYVGINVDYFDKKALEKQQRHDSARVAWGEMVQKGAEEEFRDEKARELYNQEQQKMFDEVISKNAGNLSAGYQDVIGAIEKSRLNPYHNLNKRHVEQGKLQQELAVKYGPRYIDKSKGINESLFSQDPNTGTVKWKSPMDIQANALLADEYDKNFENQVKELAATVILKETELGHTASDRFTLANKIISNEQLSYKDIQDFISMPGIHEAFLGNNPTAVEDTRKYPGLDKTYKEVLTDPEAFKTWAFGQIADKKVEKSAEKYTYRTDQEKLQNARHASAMKVAKMQEIMKRPIVSQPNWESSIGSKTLTKDDSQVIRTNVKTTKDAINNVKSQNARLDKDLAPYTSNFTLLLDQNGRINENQVKRSVDDYVDNYVKTQRNNGQDFTDDQIKQMRDDNFKKTIANLQTRMTNFNQERELEKDYNNLETIDNYIGDNTVYPVYRESFKRLTPKAKTALKNMMGISGDITEDYFIKNFEDIATVYAKNKSTSQKSLKEYLTEDKDLASGYNDLGSTIKDTYSKAKDALDKFDENGLEMQSLFTGLSNSDPNSIINKAEDQLNDSYKNLDAKTALGSFSTPDGRSVIETNPTLQEKLDNAKEILPITFKFPSGSDPYGAANTLYAVVSYKDSEGKLHTEPVEVKSDRNNPYFRETYARMLEEAALTNWDTEEQKNRAIGTAATLTGNALYGEDIIRAADLVEHDSPYQTINITAFDNNRNPILTQISMQKYNGRYGSSYLVKVPNAAEEDGFSKYYLPTKEQAINFTKELAGKIYVSDNPDVQEGFTVNDLKSGKYTYEVNTTKESYRTPVYQGGADDENEDVAQ